MTHFLEWFKRLDDDKKAEIIKKALMLATAIVNLLIKLLG